MSRAPRHGFVARTLHWLTVLALIAQYVVGYAMTGAEGVLEPWIEAAYDGDEDLLLPVHVAIGCTILALTARGIRAEAPVRRSRPVPPSHGVTTAVGCVTRLTPTARAGQ